MKCNYASYVLCKIGGAGGRNKSNLAIIVRLFLITGQSQHKQNLQIVLLRWLAQASIEKFTVPTHCNASTDGLHDQCQSGTNMSHSQNMFNSSIESPIVHLYFEFYHSFIYLMPNSMEQWRPWRARDVQGCSHDDNIFVILFVALFFIQPRSLSKKVIVLFALFNLKLHSSLSKPLMLLKSLSLNQKEQTTLVI